MIRYNREPKVYCFSVICLNVWDGIRALIEVNGSIVMNFTSARLMALNDVLCYLKF